MNVHEMKLHEIANEIQVILELFLDADGEMTPEIEARLAQLEGAEKDKSNGMCKAIRVMETQAAVAQSELDRICKLKLARARSAARLKEWMKTQLERLGQTKVETGLFVVRVQRNGRPSISFEGDKIPEQFRRITIELDGQAAYQAWKDGELPDEGFVVETGTHLRII